MMRSLYSGVSGLKNHQTRMDVIGNNIANVNTAGFKASRVVFQDIYSQMTKSSAAPNGTNVGGTNARQIGLGVNLCAIDIIHSSAAMQRTDGELDLAIEGDGFFVVSAADGSTLYTRSGNLYIDEQGNLVTAGGFYLQGFGVTEISTPIMEQFVDDLGNLVYLSDDGITECVLSSSGDYCAPNDPTETPLGTQPTSVTPVMTQKLKQATDADGNLIFDVGYTGPPTATYVLKADGKYYDTSNASDPGSATLPTGAYPRREIDPDAVTLTYEANVAGGLSNLNLAGYTGIAIDDNGLITGLNAQGKMVGICNIAIATFTNTGGLEKKGSSLYAESNNSGDPVYNAPNSGGAGKVSAGGLEMSNVDLSNEFTDMIVTQRGFQANSRIITVSDTMLEELINLKR